MAVSPQRQRRSRLAKDAFADFLALLLGEIAGFAFENSQDKFRDAGVKPLGVWLRLGARSGLVRHGIVEWPARVVLGSCRLR